MTAGFLFRVLAWLLLAAVVAGFGDRFAAELGLVSAFRLHLGVLGLLVLVLALAFRAVWVALPSGLAAALALGTLGPVWDDPKRPAPYGGTEVTLLFANVLIANPQTEAMQAALLAAGADVIVVAEAPRAMAGGPLDEAYPHRVVRDDERHPLRAAIWSRFPLEAGTVNMNDTLAPTAAAARARIGRGTALGIIGVHFARANDDKIDRQIDGLTRMAEGPGMPLAIVGDFNAPPWSPVVARAAAATGTDPVGGFRITWRGRYPPFGLSALLGQQIDHVLVSPGVGVEDVSTHSVPGSDHHALVVRLVVPKTD